MSVLGQGTAACGEVQRRAVTLLAAVLEAPDPERRLRSGTMTITGPDRPLSYLEHAVFDRFAPPVRTRLERAGTAAARRAVQNECEARIFDREQGGGRARTPA